MKTWEMIKALEENPDLKFISQDGFIASVNQLNGMFILTNVNNPCSPNGNIHLVRVDGSVYSPDSWELIPQKVTWQEAIQAWLEGKEILIKHNGKEYRQKPSVGLGNFTNYPSSSFGNRLFLDGEWYIKK